MGQVGADKRAAALIPPNLKGVVAELFFWATAKRLLEGILAKRVVIKSVAIVYVWWSQDTFGLLCWLLMAMAFGLGMVSCELWSCRRVLEHSTDQLKSKHPVEILKRCWGGVMLSQDMEGHFSTNGRCWWPGSVVPVCSVNLTCGSPA